jgi:hypothetical protein
MPAMRSAVPAGSFSSTPRTIAACCTAYPDTSAAPTQSSSSRCSRLARRTSSGSSSPTVERNPGPTRIPTSRVNRSSGGVASMSSMTRSIRWARTAISASVSTAPAARARASRALSSTSDSPVPPGCVSIVLVRLSDPATSGGHVCTGCCGPAMSDTNGIA